MKMHSVFLIVAAIGFCSCEQARKSTPATVRPKTSPASETTRSQKRLANNYEKYIYTAHQYADFAGPHLFIQNSLPKGGTFYITPKGTKYIYAVFWTRITNKNLYPLELAINFPADSFELPASSGNYMKLLVSSDTVDFSQAPSFDYGLAVKDFLDTNIQHPLSAKRTIKPAAASSFYVVALADKGVNGTLRTELVLKEQRLFYIVNGKEIPCGRITPAK